MASLLLFLYTLVTYTNNHFVLSGYRITS